MIIKSYCEQFSIKFFHDRFEQSEKTLSSMNKFQEQYLTKYLCDQCDQIKQHPIVSKGFGNYFHNIIFVINVNKVNKIFMII